MSFVARKEIATELPKKNNKKTAPKEIAFEKLAAECRICMRLKFNKGSCGGRTGQNMCIAFVESQIAKNREKAFQRR